MSYGLHAFSTPPVKLEKFYTFKIFRCGYLTISKRYAYLSADATPENAFFFYGRGKV